MIPLSLLVPGALILVAALFVVGSRNSVHAVLSLISAFVFASVLFLAAGAEFLAFILVVVYVGAVAVLFLFVVMMLDINVSELRREFRRLAPFGVLLAVLFVAEMWSGLGNVVLPAARPATATALPNTQAIGDQLYTGYLVAFQISGLILLVAMIGAIVLTHEGRRPGGRPVPDTARKPDVRLVDAKSRTGVTWVGQETGRPATPVARAIPTNTRGEADAL